MTPWVTNKLSFNCLQLNSPTDGTQDKNIHCLKAGQPCHAGLEKLKSFTDIVTAAHANPFVGIPIAVNLADEAAKLISDDSSSDAENIEDPNLEHLKSPCSVYFILVFFDLMG